MPSHFTMDEYVRAIRESAFLVPRDEPAPITLPEDHYWQPIPVRDLQVGDIIRANADTPSPLIGEQITRVMDISAVGLSVDDDFSLNLRGFGSTVSGGDHTMDLCIPAERVAAMYLRPDHMIRVESWPAPLRVVSAEQRMDDLGDWNMEIRADGGSGLAGWRFDWPLGTDVTVYRTRSISEVPEVTIYSDPPIPAYETFTERYYNYTPEPTPIERTNPDMKIQLDRIPCKRCECSKFESDYAPKVWRRGLLGAEIICRACVQARRARNAQIGERTFGIEIEFGGEGESVASTMRDLGVYCQTEDYNHSTREHWKVVYDASIEAEEGGELVSPILRGDDGLKQLKVATEALGMEGYIDSSCGVHVHHGAQDLTSAQVRRLAFGWGQNQHAIDQMLHPSRHAGRSQWCHPFSEDDFADLLEYTSNIARAASDLDRYRSLNLSPLGSRGTVEVRSLQCTFEYDYLAAWVKFGQSFILAAQKGIVEAFENADQLLDFLVKRGSLDQSHAHTLNSKVAYFASTARYL